MTTSVDRELPAAAGEGADGRSWAVLAMLLVASGVLLRGGTLQPFALVLVVLGAWLAWRAAGGLPALRVFSPRSALVLVLAANSLFWLLWVLRSGVLGSGGPVRLLVAASGIVGGLVSAPVAMRRRGGLTTGLLVGSLLLAGAALAVPHDTPIDVLVFQEVSAERLLSGVEPYAGPFEHRYPPAAVEAFYAPGIADEELLYFGFPYPPLSLLLAVPGHLLGDVRWMHLLAVAASAWILLHRSDPSPWARLGAVAFATSPFPHEVLARAWTEPFLGAAMLALLAHAGARGRLSSVGLGLVAALKQYAVLTTPTLLLADRPSSSRETIRRLAIAAASAAVTVLPFLVWNPRGFWWSVVELQFVQPYRPDSLSLLAGSVEATGWPPSWTFRILPFLVAVTVAVVAWRSGDRGPRRSAAWTALTLLAMFLVSKQAFTNYYYLAFTLLAAAASLRELPMRPAVDD